MIDRRPFHWLALAADQLRISGLTESDDLAREIEQFLTNNREDHMARTPAKLGQKYRDTITGRVGIATARAEYLHDVPSVCLEFEPDDMGRPVDAAWVAEARLVIAVDAESK